MQRGHTEGAKHTLSYIGLIAPPVINRIFKMILLIYKELVLQTLISSFCKSTKMHLVKI